MTKPKYRPRPPAAGMPTPTSTWIIQPPHRWAREDAAVRQVAPPPAREGAA